MSSCRKRLESARASRPGSRSTCAAHGVTTRARRQQRSSCTTSWCQPSAGTAAPSPSPRTCQRAAAGTRRPRRSAAAAGGATRTLGATWWCAALGTCSRSAAPARYWRQTRSIIALRGVAIRGEQAANSELRVRDVARRLQRGQPNAAVLVLESRARKSSPWSVREHGPDQTCVTVQTRFLLECQWNNWYRFSSPGASRRHRSQSQRASRMSALAAGAASS